MHPSFQRLALPSHYLFWVVVVDVVDSVVLDNLCRVHDSRDSFLSSCTLVVTPAKQFSFDLSVNELYFVCEKEKGTQNCINEASESVQDNQFPIYG